MEMGARSLIWAIVFVASWVLFFILARKNQSKLTYLGGVIAIAMQLSIDVNAHYLGLYYIRQSLIYFHGSPLLFTFGPVFTMAVLFLQYLPHSKWWQLAHIVIFITLFFIFELGVIEMGALEYQHWNHLASLFVDVTVFMALAWYGSVFVQRDSHRAD